MIRRLFIAALCLSLICIASQAAARTKVDPFLSTNFSASSFKALSISQAPNSEVHAEVFIKTSDIERTAASITAFGGKVRTANGNIITATVPIQAIEAISEALEVIFIEAGKPIGLSTDVAGEELGVQETHGGLGLPSGYSGKGIIIGIVDTGVDYRHEDFKDENGNNRILAIWDQSRSTGPGPSEITNTYGTECNVESIADGSCSLTDVDGHGTHVAGIAAARDAQYGGVAHDANIVVVKYDARLDLETGYADALFSTKICEAAYYVFSKAQQYGMPAVVNLSLGTHIGAHDGTSLFEECLGNLVQGAAGRALVAAAGNEYSGDWDYTGIHTGFVLAEETPMATNFVIQNPTSDGIYYIDVWGSAGGDLSVGLAIHEGDSVGSPSDYSGLVEMGSVKAGAFFGGKIDYMINASEEESILNGKPHVGIRIYADPAFDISNHSFDLVVKGGGVFDAWLFPDKPARTIQFTSVSGSHEGAEWLHIPGDRENNIAIPATSPEVLAIAGYVTRTHWTVGSLTWVFNGQQLGELLNFSSSGPTSDPSFTGHKPEIAAPGGMIASTKSSQAIVGSQVIMDDGEHFLQSGTSMAAPFVSGTIAMMFEANPNFTYDDVRSILIQGVYTDASVPSVPHDRWGYGKLDVLKSMEIAVVSEASGVFDASGSIAAPSGLSVSGGKSSCRIVASSSQAVCAIDVALIIAFLICLVAGRRSRVALFQDL